jgi:hypothetical protein
MPRNGSEVAVRLPDTAAVSGQSIKSSPYNREITDIYAVINSPALVPITGGGTGGRTAAEARTNLGISDSLVSLGGLASVINQIPYTSAPGIWAASTLAPFWRTVLDDADAATSRTTLGAQAIVPALNTLAAGDLLYASAANTLSRLPKSTAFKVLRMNAAATAPEWGAGIQNQDGTPPLLVARAWAFFSGAGAITIYNSNNIASIVRGAVGDYQLTYIDPMPTNSYACIPVSLDFAAMGVTLTTQAAASVRIQTRDVLSTGPAADSAIIMVVIFA